MQQTDTMPTGGPPAFTLPSTSATPTNPGDSSQTPPAAPPAGGPQTVYTNGSVQFYPSSSVSGGFNLGGPSTTLPSGTQVTQTGDTSLQFTTGGSGGLFGIGINNMTPVTLVTDPATGQIYSSGHGQTGYIVSPAWNSGITKENPFWKK